MAQNNRTHRVTQLNTETQSGDTIFDMLQI
jgi:hypothetical protein